MERCLDVLYWFQFMAFHRSVKKDRYIKNGDFSAQSVAS